MSDLIKREDAIATIGVMYERCDKGINGGVHIEADQVGDKRMSDMMTQEEAMDMSNEQAVQILIPMRNMMCDQNGCPISDAVFALDKAIEALSADRPQGEWIDAEIPLESGDTMPIQVCNLCKTFYPLVYTGGGHRFCPNCGARMLKGADDGRR